MWTFLIFLLGSSQASRENFSEAVFSDDYGLDQNISYYPKDSTQTPIPLCERPDLWPEYEDMITDTINNCSATQRLSELAENISLSKHLPAWRIKIVPVDSQPFVAESTLDNGEIRIVCDEQEATSMAVFELTNFGHQNDFYKLEQDAWSDNVTREEFAEIGAEIEFNGTQIHHKAMEECIEELGWKPGVQFWRTRTWENWWALISNTSYAEYWRQLYRKKLI